MIDYSCRVAVVTQAPFPEGNVSTMRYTSYLKSLSKSGVFTYVLVYCPTRMAAHIKERSGVHDGIKYQYVTDITWKNYNIYNKIRYLIKGLFKSISYLNENKISTVILYGDNILVVNLFYWAYSKITGKRFIGDRSELPTVQERQSKLRMWVYGIKQRMFDGMIIMTKQLMSFYSQYSTDSEFLFFLPMTIDPQRFQNAKREKQQERYIAIVFGTHNRDGLEESLKSYDMYCQKGGKYDLWLIGDYDKMPNKETLYQIIQSSDYSNKIKILGRQANQALPSILVSASILMTTPNYYVSGGFPTKLGEYMLSGVPIVATKTGELLDYIAPNEDMLMSEPGDINNISDCLLRLEQDSSLAKVLSANAKRKAEKVFCADSYLKAFQAFLMKK